MTTENEVRSGWKLLARSSSASRFPSSRYRSSTAYCPSLDSLVLIGGAANDKFVPDFWVFSFKKKKWEEVTLGVLSSEVAHRVGGTLTLVEETLNSCKLLLHGGIRSVSSAGVTEADLSLTFVLNISNVGLDALQLSLRRVEGDSASRGYQQAAVRYGQYVYVYSGLRNYIDGNAMHLLSAKFLLLLGKNSMTLRFVNDLHRYSIENDSWEMVKATNGTPSPRYGHMIGVHHGNNPKEDHLILFGGRALKGFYSDMWAYSFHRNAWTLLAAPKTVLSRSFASMHILENHIYIFGGIQYNAVSHPAIKDSILFASLNFDRSTYGCFRNGGKSQFCELAIDNDVVGKRMDAATIMRNDTMIIFGGQNSQYDDLWGIDLIESSSELNSIAFDSTYSFYPLLQFLFVVGLACGVMFAVSLMLKRLYRTRFEQQRRVSHVAHIRSEGASEDVIKQIPLITYSPRVKHEDANKNETSKAGDATEITKTNLVNSSTTCPNSASQEGTESVELALEDIAKDNSNIQAEGISTQTPAPVQSLNEPCNDIESGLEVCAICICEFQEGDKLRLMPCNHMFHPNCVDVWLRRNKSCPMCKREIE